MKVTFLSNDTNRYIRLLNDFAKCCRKFVSICKGISHILDMLSLCELQDVINDSHKFEAAFLSVVELRTLLDELAEIQLEANNTLSMLSSSNRLISSVTTEQGKVSLVELGTLDTILPKVRFNAAYIPTWVPAAEAVKFSDEIEGQRVINVIRSLTDDCWKMLIELNKALDNFPIDRSNSIYCHLPETASEL